MPAVSTKTKKKKKKKEQKKNQTNLMERGQKS